jgi:3'-phosphoadenosine 5'-phosphosulfate sulfotransferase (PAPS reductase)/FAD synthetase
MTNKIIGEANVVTAVSCSRHIIWFSCGAASTVTADIVRKEYPDAMLVRIWLGGEHPDNERYVRDVERWMGVNVTTIKSDEYDDHFQVIDKTGWVNGVGGARCTGELKKKVRFKFQRVGDIQYFGYTAEPRERARAQRFVERFPEVNARFPLIERGLTKEECGGIIVRHGIELPMMYRLGFNNNNCIGCVKGGKGYWNKVRTEFPETFDKMMNLERKVGASCIKGTYLDELEPDAGRHEDFEISCDFVCEGYK